MTTEEVGAAYPASVSTDGLERSGAQASFWPEGFAQQFLPAKRKWGAWEAMETANIKTALEQVRDTPAADVIAALIFSVDCYQITTRAQADAINRLRGLIPDE